jgi:G:T-mismatch repair DNA endonuclease (very short patch repair protein)
MARIHGKDTNPNLSCAGRYMRWDSGFASIAKICRGNPTWCYPDARRLFSSTGAIGTDTDVSAGRLSKSRVEFWSNKIRGNWFRDAGDVKALNSFTQ